MKNDILKKISRELSFGIDTEPKCLYLLAEIRKFLDQCSKKERNKYPDLYFYCNWVLHSEMNRTPAKKILNRIEKHFSKSKKLREMANIFIKKEKNLYLLLGFRRQLEKFLKTHNFPVNLVNSSFNWSKFRKLLVQILIDSPLVNNSSMVHKIVYVVGSGEHITLRVHIREVKEVGSFKVAIKEKVKS